ncbi:hypothetical protein [Lacticigenium naphthae]|uniref:hypothetical protein n=1 Tax=Lacticigenium naphthae TaxID=515351 RepID=UPI000406C152|nr:hypothetical protein [Lacticigenium naphthae]
MSKKTQRYAKFLFHSLWIIPALTWAVLLIDSSGRGVSIREYITQQPQIVVVLLPTFLMIVWLFIYKTIWENGTVEEYKRMVFALSVSSLLTGNFASAILGYLTWKGEAPFPETEKRSNQQGLNIALIILLILSVFYVFVVNRYYL